MARGVEESPLFVFDESQGVIAGSVLADEAVGRQFRRPSPIVAASRVADAAVERDVERRGERGGGQSAFAQPADTCGGATTGVPGFERLLQPRVQI